MFTQFSLFHKPALLLGIALCSLMLTLSSCDDAGVNKAVSGPDEPETETTVVSASGETIQIARASTIRDVYWTGIKARTDESIIARSYVDGQGTRQTEVLYRGNQLGSPFGVAIDLKEEMIYWTDDDEAFIARSSLDGSGSVDTLYSGAQDGVSFPGYLALNLITDELIWADEAGILKGSLDGSAPVDTVYTVEQGVNVSLGVDLLLIGDLVYWTELGDNEIVAGRAGGDIEPQVLFEASDASPGLSFLFDLEIDLLSGRLYVSDGSNSADSRILRGSLLGTGSLETIYSGPGEFAAASSLTIDHLGRNLYWSQTVGADFSGTILRGPLNGEGTPELVYDLRDFEDEGIAQISSIAIGDPLGLKGKQTDTNKQTEQEVIYLHF